MMHGMEDYEKKEQKQKIKLLMDAMRVVRNKASFRKLYQKANEAEAKSNLFKALR